MAGFLEANLSIWLVKRKVAHRVRCILSPGKRHKILNLNIIEIHAPLGYSHFGFGKIEATHTNVKQLYVNPCVRIQMLQPG